MSAERFLDLLTQALYVLVALVVTVRAVRSRTRTNTDTAMLFGALALIVASQWFTVVTGEAPGHLHSAFTSSLLMAVPYLLLRLLADFSTVRASLHAAAVLGLVLSVPTLFILPVAERPPWVVLVMVAYFFAVSAVVARGFVRETQQASGVTRRRMRAVAGGTALLGLIILGAGAAAAVPEAATGVSVVNRLLGLASGVAFYVGFATPAWLKSVWQMPEVQQFLARAGALTRAPDIDALIGELETGVATALGTPHARVIRFDEERGLLRAPLPSGELQLRPGEGLAGRVFATQRPLFSTEPPADSAPAASAFLREKVAVALYAPITVAEKKLGVLVAYASRAPVFAEDDLNLLTVLSVQAAVLIESRILVEQAAQVRVREQTARMKDDFLASAAHDLKTPLTALIMQAELLERRVERNPSAPVDAELVHRITRSAQRLRALVLELLDAVQAERGVLRIHPEPTELSSLVTEAVQLVGVSPSHRVEVEQAGEVVGMYDRNRLMQVVTNLVDNAVKYSPEGGVVAVSVRREQDRAIIVVADQGIGIPPEDVPHIFERYRRAQNAADDRRFHGLGLGLYITRAIIAQHGGTISVDSVVGKGTTFRISLPVGA